MISDDRILLRHRLILSVFVVLMCLTLEYTPVDSWFSNLFYDETSGSFVYRRHWFFSTVMHDGGRQLVFVIVLAVLVIFVISFIKPVARGCRYPLGMILVSMMLTTGSIAAIKYSSDTHCPYHLREYGGKYQRVDLSERASISQPAGKCWPGGHASAGFSLWAFYFVALAYRRALAVPAFLLPLALGIAFGLAQTIRGAHFISHTAWSGLMVWVINLVLFSVFPLRHQSESDQLHDHNYGGIQQ